MFQSYYRLALVNIYIDICQQIAQKYIKLYLTLYWYY